MSLKEKLKKSTKVSAPHLIIKARAGTGKTTTLVEGLKVLQGGFSDLEPSPQQEQIWEAIKLSAGAKSVCFVAFNKSIAQELKQRVPTGCNAMTMHSMGLKSVTAAYGRLKLEGGKVTDVVAKLLGVDIWDARKKYPVVLKAVDKLVGLCKANLLDGSNEDLDVLTSQFDIDTNSSVTLVYELVPQVLEICADPEQDGRMDFNDMIWLPVVNNLPLTKYDLLMVDEAQDLNRCQQQLAIRSGRRLIFCGDDKQAIYGFAGADGRSLLYLESNLTNVEVLPLTVTHRCGVAIVKEAQKYVPDFEAHKSNCEGIVRYATVSDTPKKIDNPKTLHQVSCEAERIATESERGVGYRQVVRDGDMVLCRVNAPLVQQCFKFLKEGRKANIQGRDIGKGLIDTINRMKAGDIVELVAKLETWNELEVQKENAKKFPSESKLLSLGDRYSCLLCFIAGKDSIEAVTESIEKVFTDDTTGGIRLSSIHKAKGLEANRVFLLQPEGATIPHPMAKTAQDVEQEYNLLYVAITRAIEELVYVN